MTPTISKKGYIKSHVISPPSENELLIKTLYSGISFGTEKIVFTGDVPTSQRELMRCPYQEGSFGRDVKYGYINIGKVIDGMDNIDKIKKGDGPNGSVSNPDKIISFRTE